MTRTYYKYARHIESFVYDGNKLVLHLIYYKPFGYGYPRYHFENFCLLFQQLNYEISRFMMAVNKIISDPYLDLDVLDSDISESLF